MTQEEQRNFLDRFKGLEPIWQKLCYQQLNIPEQLFVLLQTAGLQVGEGDRDCVVQLLRNQNFGAGGGIINQEQQETPYERYLAKEAEKHGEGAAAQLRTTINDLSNLTEQRNSGLIVGRVQSGKTASYIGLIAALKERGWNVVISLTSNKINLGNQTDRRFFDEFNEIDIVPEYLNDLTGANIHRAQGRIKNEALFLLGVYLKNKSQLSNISTVLELIRQYRQGRSLKVLILDDEADNCSQNTKSQASYKRELENFIRNLPENDPAKKLLEYLRDHRNVFEDTLIPEGNDQDLDELLANFKKATYENLVNNIPDNVLTAPERQKLRNSFKDLEKRVKTAVGYVFRSTVNQKLVDLVNWLKTENIQCSYSAWTATPFANILNEMPEGTPLFPKFVYSLTPPVTYQGASQIFLLENCSRIYTDVSNTLTDTKGYLSNKLSEDLTKAIQWFLCAAAARRYMRKAGAQFSAPYFSSMLIHVETGNDIATAHDNLAKLITTYLCDQFSPEKEKAFFESCREVYDAQINQYPAFNPPEGYPENRMSQYPKWEQISQEMEYFAIPNQIAPFCKIDRDAVRQIEQYNRINIVMDNSKNPGARLCYPDAPKDDLSFIVLGGMTMSRGMTLEGLVSTYLTHTANNADTQMQFGRFFGHHVGFELLPRLWLGSGLSALYKDLAVIENAMHDSIRQNRDTPNEVGFFAPEIKITQARGRGQGQRKLRLKLTGNDRNAVCDKNDRAEIRTFSVSDIAENFSRIDNVLRKFDAPQPRLGRDCFLWERITSKDIQDLVKALRLPDEAPEFTPPVSDDWFVILSGPKTGNRQYTLAGCDMYFREPALTGIQGGNVLAAIGGNIADNKHWALPVEDSVREAYWVEYCRRYPGTRPAKQGTPDYIDGLLSENGFGDRPIFVINGVFCGHEHPALSFAYRVPGQREMVINRGNR